MKVLSVNPPLLPIDRYGSDLARVGAVTEPLGLAFVAAALERRGAEVEILDTIALRYRGDDIRNHIKGKNYDVVGITMLTPMYLVATEVARLVKSVMSDVKIMVGGAHPTLMPRETMEEILILKISGFFVINYHDSNG